MILTRLEEVPLLDIIAWKTGYVLFELNSRGISIQNTKGLDVYGLSFSTINKIKMKRFFQRIVWTKWKIAKTGWPYPDGYGTFKKHRFSGRLTIMDTGLSYDQAIISAHNLNNSK